MYRVNSIEESLEVGDGVMKIRMVFYMKWGEIEEVRLLGNFLG